MTLTPLTVRSISQHTHKSHKNKHTAHTKVDNWLCLAQTVFSLSGRRLAQCWHHLIWGSALTQWISPLKALRLTYGSKQETVSIPSSFELFPAFWSLVSRFRRLRGSSYVHSLLQERSAGGAQAKVQRAGRSTSKIEVEIGSWKVKERKAAWEAWPWQGKEPALLFGQLRQAWLFVSVKCRNRLPLMLRWIRNSEVLTDQVWDNWCRNIASL